jgi:alpha-L-rhamnosidase
MTPDTAGEHGGIGRRSFLAGGAAVAGLSLAAGTAGAARASTALTAAGPTPFPTAGQSAAGPGIQLASQPSGLLTSLLDDALGVPVSGMRLSWIVPAIGDASRQDAYQVQVAATPDAFTDGLPGGFPGGFGRAGALVWDSGQVSDSSSTAVSYAGPDLSPATPYWWRVRTWASDGASDGAGAAHVSQWSAPQRIVTAAADWTGVPVWAPADTTTLTDGVLSATVTIETTSAGLWFRAQDADNNYLWQIFDGSPGILRTHVQSNGVYTVLDNYTLPVDVTVNEPIDISISMTGDVFETFINGTLVNTTTNSTYASGTIGLRNGSTESQRYQSVTFTDPDGTHPISTDFADGPAPFTGGTVSDGSLVLGDSQSLLAEIAEPDDWALLRTEFTLPPKRVLIAFVQAAAASPEGAHQYVYKLWCNGSVAGHGPSRSQATETRYNTLDITGLVRPGANALAALCYTASDHQFQAQAVVVFEDGTSQVIGTTGGWSALRGAKMLPSDGFTGGGYFNDPQEYWDMRQEPVGWTKPGFDDTGWLSAAPGTAFAALAPAAVNLTQTYIKPAAVTQVAPGQWLVDLGKEIAGGLHVRVSGTSGDTITVQLGEQADGTTVVYQLLAGNTYSEVWTLRDGWQDIEHWGYRGFRWAQLITSDTGLDLSAAVQGVALHMDWHEDDSSFACSDPSLTRVWEFARYSIKATSLDLYQDTPTRERDPYEGDALIDQRSQYAVQRSYGLARYSNSWLCRRPTWPAEYHLMSVLSAWQDYLATGDPDHFGADYSYYVAKNFDADLGSDGLVHKAPGSSSQYNADLVDWPAVERDGYVFTDVNTVINSFQYAAYATLSQVAGVLGNSADEAKYAVLARQVQSAINTLLLPAGADAYVDGEGTTHTALHATFFPVALGVPDAAHLPAMGAFLAAAGMVCSVYGAQFLLEALFASGQADAAHALLTATGLSSWLHMMDDLDATITMEAWDPSIKSNTTFSHAWGTAPANVVMREILGVQVTAPGAAALLIRPRPGPLTWMNGTVPTIRGPVRVSVDRREGLRVTVGLPANTTARVVLDTAALGAAPGSLRIASPGRRGPGAPGAVSAEGGLVTVSGVWPGTTVITGAPA